MRRFGVACVIAMLLTFVLLAGTGVAWAQTPARESEANAEQLDEGSRFLPNWGFHGSNTLRYDHFDSDGPESPYPFDGNQIYDEFNLDFRNQDGPYSQWRGQLSGVLLNERDYRAADRGVVPERMNLTREAGDRKLGERTVPYRWEIGDYFSYSSIMTQQRSVKGVQIEVQPQFAGRPDSLLWFAGTNEPSWQEVFESDAFADDISAGTAYLFESENFGSWNFDAIFNHREAEDPLAPDDRNQGVVSAAVEKAFDIGQHEIRVEIEEAVLYGEVDVAENEVGSGTFIEISGKHRIRPLDYRVRGEVYDRHYAPRGAIVTRNRASGEGHVGWSFDNGVRVRGRVQGYAEGFQKDDQLDTVIGGINATGPLGLRFLPTVSGSADLFVQNRENESETTDDLTVNFSTGLSSPLGWGWLGRFGALVQDRNDRTPADADQTTIQFTGNADHDFRLGPFEGVVTPGFLMRFLVDASPDSDEYQPTLAVRMGYRGHSAGLNYGALIQERDSGGGAADFKKHTLAADYRLQIGPNTFGTEFQFFGLDREPGKNTEAWNAGVYWTLAFGRPAAPIGSGHSAFIAPPDEAMAQPLVAASIQRGDVGEIAPGLPLDATRQRLATLGIVGASRQTDIDVYETPVLRRVDQRQRLVLVHDDEVVLASGLIIEFASAGAVESSHQLFERVREELVAQFGPPTRGFERGGFGKDIVSDINSEQLVRLVEWDLPTGIVRFGIPRRHDGQARMEIQQRKSFPPTSETLWSIEAVR